MRGISQSKARSAAAGMGPASPPTRVEARANVEARSGRFEVVFDLPGMGFLLATNIRAQQFIAVQSIVAILAIGYVVLLMSADYIEDGDYYEGEFSFLLLSSLLGMVVMSSARDLVTIFLALIFLRERVTRVETLGVILAIIAAVLLSKEAPAAAQSKDP